jgi:hypothetical protein
MAEALACMKALEAADEHGISRVQLEMGLRYVEGSNLLNNNNGQSPRGNSKIFWRENTNQAN